MESLNRGERPWMQLMFKFEGDTVRKGLQEHIRCSGYPDWLSVTTSPSGSYREEHILQFLERHLPVKADGRRWRIVMADDYGPSSPLITTGNCMESE